MALMLLATYIRPYLADAALSLWYAAVVTHICLMVFFFRRFVSDFKLGAVFPSWFITFVGIVTVSVTAPAMDVLVFGQAAFYVGLLLYFVAFVIVVCRMGKVRIFPEPARPTIAIFTAPMSLLVVGYFSSFVQQGQVNAPLVYAMLAIAAASYIYVTAMLASILRKKFYPTYAALTFPYVISALAFRIGADFLASRYGFDFLIHIANATQWVAVAVVIFVLIHYARYFVFWLKF